MLLKIRHRALAQRRDWGMLFFLLISVALLKKGKGGGGHAGQPQAALGMDGRRSKGGTSGMARRCFRYEILHGIVVDCILVSPWLQMLQQASTNERNCIPNRSKTYNSDMKQ